MDAVLVYVLFLHPLPCFSCHLQEHDLLHISICIPKVQTFLLIAAEHLNQPLFAYTIQHHCQIQVTEPVRKSL